MSMGIFIQRNQGSVLGLPLPRCPNPTFFEWKNGFFERKKMLPKTYNYVVFWADQLKSKMHDETHKHMVWIFFPNQRDKVRGEQEEKIMFHKAHPPKSISIFAPLAQTIRKLWNNKLPDREGQKQNEINILSVQVSFVLDRFAVCALRVSRERLLGDHYLL